jgi:hypothetical protein
MTARIRQRSPNGRRSPESGKRRADPEPDGGPWPYWFPRAAPLLARCVACLVPARQPQRQTLERDRYCSCSHAAARKRRPSGGDMLVSRESSNAAESAAGATEGKPIVRLARQNGADCRRGSSRRRGVGHRSVKSTPDRGGVLVLSGGPVTCVIDRTNGRVHGRVLDSERDSATRHAVESDSLASTRTVVSDGQR